MDVEQLQNLLLHTAGAQPDPRWPEVLEPYKALLMRRDALFVYLSGRFEIHMSPLLWVVSLERSADGSPLRHADSLLRAVVELQRREGVAAPLEQRHAIETGNQPATDTTPLNWVLLCRRQFYLGLTADISSQRLLLLLEMGADPNAPFYWRGSLGEDFAHGQSPLCAVLTRSTCESTPSLLLRFGARFDRHRDAGGLMHAMVARPVAPLLQLLRHYPEALNGVEHTIWPTLPDQTPLHILVRRRNMDIPGAVIDAQFLHKTLKLSLLPRDMYHRTAADWAESRAAMEETVTPQWRELSDYLRPAETAEEEENKRRMSLAVHRVLARPLGSELANLIINAQLPEEVFAKSRRLVRPPPT